MQVEYQGNEKIVAVWNGLRVNFDFGDGTFNITEGRHIGGGSLTVHFDNFDYADGVLQLEGSCDASFSMVDGAGEFRQAAKDLLEDNPHSMLRKWFPNEANSSDAAVAALIANH